MKVLIVEDDVKIAKALEKGLTLEKYIVDNAYDGETGLDLASSEKYDILILDVMLPRLTGIEIVQKLRKSNIFTPVLILTALGELDNKLSGFDAGADDYLVKPFAFTELLARIKALTRRSKKIESSTLTSSSISLNTDTFEVLLNNKPVELSKKEFSLLEYLMRNKGKIVSKEKIISQVWNYESNILPNTIEVFIASLRNKIGKEKIVTQRGFGYKLNV